MTSSGHAHLFRHRYVACREVASNVGENLGVGFLYGVYRPGNEFELIPTVKNGTRRSVEGSFLVVTFRRSKIIEEL